MSFRLSLLLILLPCAGFSQTWTGGKLCFTPAQAARTADSLRVLPLVRQEAAGWHRAAGQYLSAADSLNSAYLSQLAATRQMQVALGAERQLRENDQAEAAVWRKRARKRGLLNWLGLAAAGGVGYLLIFR